MDYAEGGELIKKVENKNKIDENTARDYIR